MQIIETSIFNVLKRFSDRKDSIKALFRKSETFQTLCEDYRQCAAALRRWDALLTEEAHARRVEYSALMEELEEEILKNLNDYEKNE
jgi:hypothetical protein